MSTATPTWAPPALDLPPARVPDAVREANNDVARPAAEARAMLDALAPLAATVHANAHLSPAGQQAEFTRLASPRLTTLHAHRTALEAAADEATQEAVRLDTATVTRSGPLSPAELDRRLAVAVRFSHLPRAEQAAWIGEAMTGRSPVKLAALVAEDPAITGLTPEQHARLQQVQRAAHLDLTARARLADRAALIHESLAVVQSAIRALEDATDRTALRTAGLATLRRSDLGDAAAHAAFIRDHGLAAYKALPA